MRSHRGDRARELSRMLAASAAPAGQQTARPF
jgi:hypothetical protein